MVGFRATKLDIIRYPDLITRINGFKKKAEDLLKFHKSVNWGIHNVSVDRTDEHHPLISGSLPNELVLEAMYRRIRFFIMNDEKSNYFRLIKLLSQSSSDQHFQELCRSWKKNFYKEWSLEFAFISAKDKFTPSEVIDYWFNAYYFHDNEDKTVELEKLTRSLGENGAKVVLFHTASNCCTRVFNLLYLLECTSEQNPIIKCPVKID